MSLVIEKIKKSIIDSKEKVSIVFAEGWNQNIIEAAKMLKSTEVIEPILVVRKKSEKIDDLTTYVIEDYDTTKFAETLYELRKAKGLTLEKAQTLVKQPNYFSTMLVKEKIADGMICGIEYTTKDTLMPALQIVKSKPGIKTVGSAFIMEKNDECYIFGDCSINLNPTSEQLCDIANGLIDFAQAILGIKHPSVAMLSYSTYGSGAGESVDKVKLAAETLRSQPHNKDNLILGEIQFDAAFVNQVRAKKAPHIKLDHAPNIFVFPTLDAGNIGYKIAQRMGGYDAVGPALIGIASPINDLSRGASTQDVISLSYITAAQVIGQRKK